jgi:hypothetical protein
MKPQDQMLPPYPDQSGHKAPTSRSLSLCHTNHPPTAIKASEPVSQRAKKQSDQSRCSAKEVSERWSVAWAAPNHADRYTEDRTYK